MCQVKLSRCSNRIRLSQQCLGRRGQGPAASHDVFFGGVLGNIMTDSADTRNEEHAGREVVGENLSVVAGTAGHADPLAGGIGFGCCSQALLYGRVHGGGFTPGGYGCQIDLHGPLFVGFLHDSFDLRLQGIKN